MENWSWKQLYDIILRYFLEYTHTHTYIYIERERQNYILGILHNSISIVSQDTNFRHNYWWRLGSFRRILIFRGRGLEHSGPLQYWKSFPTSLFFFFSISLYTVAESSSLSITSCFLQHSSMITPDQCLWIVRLNEC